MSSPSARLRFEVRKRIWLRHIRKVLLSHSPADFRPLEIMLKRGGTLVVNSEHCNTLSKEQVGCCQLPYVWVTSSPKLPIVPRKHARPNTHKPCFNKKKKTSHGNSADSCYFFFFSANLQRRTLLSHCVSVWVPALDHFPWGFDFGSVLFDVQQQAPACKASRCVCACVYVCNLAGTFLRQACPACTSGPCTVGSHTCLRVIVLGCSFYF